MYIIAMKSLTVLQVFFGIANVYGGFTLEQGIPHFNTKPFFFTPLKTEITALEGQSAHLHCRVAQLGDKKVSWIRGRDLHVLTSGLHTFASDERFQPIHQDRSENWTLHIRYSQERDSGEYQCQINTEPKKSISFFLSVQEAKTEIAGSAQRYVKAGSTLQLNCITSASTPQPGLLYWYKDSELLQIDSKVTISTKLEDMISSSLKVEKAQEGDSGNYTCWPTKYEPASVMVHVIPEEEPAAMSHGTLSGNGGGTTTNTSSSTSHKFNTFNCILHFITFLSLMYSRITWLQLNQFKTYSIAR